jgi:hypothetical protein
VKWNLVGAGTGTELGRKLALGLKLALGMGLGIFLNSMVMINRKEANMLSGSRFCIYFPVSQLA